MKTTQLIICAIILVTSVCHASFVKDWEQQERASKIESLSFHVALPQHNLEGLESLLYAVSDPESPKYGKHATKQEIDQLINPTKQEHDRVFNFFKNAGSSFIVESYGDALKVTATIDELTDLFKTEFYWHQHTPTGHRVIRAHQAGIVIPSSIASHIYMLTGLVSFPIIQKQSNKVSPISPVEAATDGFFAPSTLRLLYNVSAANAVATNAKSSQAAVEFTPEGAFSYADYVQFDQLADEKYYNFTKIVGPFNATSEWGNGESELDVQLLGTIGAGAQNWFWTINDGWIYEMAVQIFNAKEKPWVYSISYGWPEVLTCGGTVVNSNCTNETNAQYINRANVELQKLGAIGLSVISCSQDEGAPSEANDDCSNTTHPVFGIYPGSSPYLTSVSGTAATGDGPLKSPQPPICDGYPCSNSTTEVPCMPTTDAYGWTTGGGFSEITAMPSFQKTVVEAYIKGKGEKPPTKYYWPKNRGYPDVSAIGARTLIVSGGGVSLGEGTSASTPIVAGLVTLLNDYRFNQNKAPLGWLNPLLYKMAAANPKAFRDVTTGDNKCAGEGACCKYGYEAVAGWDAVTGLGTPNYGNWLEYVKSLP